MERQKKNRNKLIVFSVAVVLVMCLAIALSVPAQQQMGQQRQGGLQHEAEPGLPASCTTAVYSLDGGEDIQTGKTYTSTTSGVIESAIFVENGGWLTLRSPKIIKKGDSDGEYGGQAVEAASGGVVNILDGEIYTDTNYGNALWATNEGSLIYMKGGSITTTAGGGHGVDVTKRGSVALYDVKISTEGQSAAGALVNDSGDGNICAVRVTAHTKGPGSSGFYMIGSKSMLILVDSTLEAETSEGGVLVHGSIVDATNSNISGGKAGIKVSGGTLTISGGSVSATAGDAFYVGGGEGGVPSGDQAGGGGQGGMPGGGMPGGNMPEGGMAGGGMPSGGMSGGGMPEGGMPGGGMPEGGMPEGGMPEGGMAGGGMPGGGQGGMPSGGMSGGGMPGGGLMAGMPGMQEIDSTITVSNGTKISCTGNLINVAASTKGSFAASGTELKGDVVVAEEGEFTLSLNNSTLTGTVDGAAMTLGANSKWNVTGDSVLTSLSNTSGISGTSITNIIGNGHTVLYDKDLEGNKALGGKTYTLASGGKLTPKK